MPSKKAPPAPEPQDKLKQTDLPRLSLADSEKIALAIVNEFGGREASPPDVALAAGISPTSSSWRVLTGSSVAYGLTSGGHNALTIKLEELGRRLIAPESEGEDLTARREAVLKPRICKQFFERYQRAKFPSDAIAQNVLRSLGVPNDRLAEAANLVRENGKYAGFIRDTPTGPFVTLDSPVIPAPAATNFL